MNKIYVAVYGTLKQGEPNFSYYLENCKKLDNIRVKGKLYQFLKRSYPVIIESYSKTTECEVYEIDTDKLLAMYRMEAGAGYRLGLQNIKVENKTYPVFYFYMSKLDKKEQEERLNEVFIPIENYSFKTVNETRRAYVDNK